MKKEEMGKRRKKMRGDEKEAEEAEQLRGDKKRHKRR